MKKHGFDSPSNYVGAEDDGEEKSSPARGPVEDPMLQRVIKLVTKKKGITVIDLCNALDASPKKMIGLIEAAEEQGYSLGVAHGVVGIKPPSARENGWSVKPANYKPGQMNKIAVCSDLHAGSTYHLKPALRAFIEKAYSEGVRDFFNPGDLLEGCYRHAQWELSHASWEGQAHDLLDSIPDLPGMNFHFIDGNHDWTWTERNGYESGKALVTLAKSIGRKGFHYYGARGALINYGGTRIELWHPKKGLGYSLSYQLQNHIRDTNPRKLPDLLFTGHWHKYVKLRQQDVWAFASGTFQHPDGPYGRSIGGDTSMGGLIVSWRKDSDGVVRTLSDEFRVVDYATAEHSV
jgi:predicted phosphodiesterase